MSDLRETTRSSPYSEEDRWATDGNVSELQLEVALIRERLMRCNDHDLHRLVTRVNTLIDQLPNIPMTEAERENARRLANGFRSLFVVERATERTTG